MGEESDRGRPKGKAGRTARGFVRAGGLIEAQMRTAAARQGYAQARLRALWPEIAGPEFAAICAPVRLARARGPAGGLLTVAVSGAHAPQLQMLIPLLRERINATLGPGAVGRIQLTQAVHGFAEPRAAYQPPPAAPAARGDTPAVPDPVTEEISSIGDGELRGALETLARNVLSRTRNPKRSEP
jgi:hypothetical protein